MNSVAKTAEASPSTLGIPAWPAGDVPAPAEAEDAVRAVLSGAGGGLDASLAQALLARVTDEERAVFDGGGDGEVERALRAATALRWRLAVAVATAPREGRFDGEAAGALLADADRILGTLQRVAGDLPSTTAIRKALVEGAVEVQAAAMRLAAGAERAAIAAGEPPPPPPVTRSIFVVAEGAALEPPRRSGMGRWIALALAIVAGAAYHGHAWLNRPSARPPVDGAPVEAVAGRGAGKQTVIFTPDGKAMPPPELERLRATQAQRGMAVRELATGVYAIEPQSASGGEAR